MDGIAKEELVLAVVESERHFVAVGLEMLRANTMPSTNHAALKQAERRFDGVGMNIAVHVDLVAVPDRLVLGPESKPLSSSAIERVIVRHKHFDIIADILADVLFERPAFHIVCMEESPAQARWGEKADKQASPSVDQSSKSKVTQKNVSEKSGLPLALFRMIWMTSRGNLPVSLRRRRSKPNSVGENREHVACLSLKAATKIQIK